MPDHPTCCAACKRTTKQNKTCPHCGQSHDNLDWAGTKYTVTVDYSASHRDVVNAILMVKGVSSIKKVK